MWGTLENNKMLAELRGLATEYAPKLFELVNEESWKFFGNEDGGTYHIGGVRSPSDMEWFLDHNALVQTNQPVILMREDYFEEIGSPDITSIDAFYEALVQIKANHPETIPFYTGGLTGQHPTGMSYLQYFFGLSTYYALEDDTVVRSYRKPEYIDMCLWMNKLAREGLYTKDSFVDNSEQKDSKSMQGLVASYAWTIGESGKIPADNPDTAYNPMKPWTSYVQERTNAGWQCYAISAKSENKQRAICVVEFGSSKYGAWTVEWGVEGPTPADGGEWNGDLINGPHFYFDETGKANHYAGYIAARNADWSGCERTSGIGYYGSYMTFNAIYGGQAAITGSEFMATMNEWYGPYVTMNNRFLYIFPSGNDVAVARQKITDLDNEYFAAMVFAANEDEVRSLYAEFLEKVESVEGVFYEFLTQEYRKNIGLQ